MLQSWLFWGLNVEDSRAYKCNEMLEKGYWHPGRGSSRSTSLGQLDPHLWENLLTQRGYFQFSTYLNCLLRRDRDEIGPKSLNLLGCFNCIWQSPVDIGQIGQVSTKIHEYFNWFAGCIWKLQYLSRKESLRRPYFHGTWYINNPWFNPENQQIWPSLWDRDTLICSSYEQSENMWIKFSLKNLWHHHFYLLDGWAIHSKYILQSRCKGRNNKIQNHHLYNLYTYHSPGHIHRCITPLNRLMFGIPQQMMTYIFKQFWQPGTTELFHFSLEKKGAKSMPRLLSRRLSTNGLTKKQWRNTHVWACEMPNNRISLLSCIPKPQQKFFDFCKT